MDNHRQIGFIGAGRMGLPIIERLVEGGQHLRVFARRPEVRSRVQALGAELVDSPRDLSTVDVLISGLYDDEQQLSVLPPVLAGLRHGAVFLTHTTCTPATVQHLSAAARHLGVVEAPFSGTAEDVRASRLTVYLGGEPQAVTVAQDVVKWYADPVIHTGVLGSAMRTKLINNLLFAAISQVTLQALQAASAFGLDESAVLVALGHGSGGSAAARHIAALGGAESFSAAVAPYLAKDIAACVEAARSDGSDVAAALDGLLVSARSGPIGLDGAGIDAERGVDV